MLLLALKGHPVRCLLLEHYYCWLYLQQHALTLAEQGQHTELHTRYKAPVQKR